MSLKSRALAAAFALSLGLIGAGSISAPAQAAPYNYAVIKNSIGSGPVLNVCRDWGNTTCASGSPRGYLHPGENSKTKYGWGDTDGFYVPSGYRAVSGSTYVGPKWVKKSGCAGCTILVNIQKI